MSHWMVWVPSPRLETLLRIGQAQAPAAACGTAGLPDRWHLCIPPGAVRAVMAGQSRP